LEHASKHTDSLGSAARECGGSAAAAHFARLRKAGAAVAFIALFLALEWLSFLHEQGGRSVTPWNPGLGVAFAMVLYRGLPYAVLLFAGVLVTELLVVRNPLEWPVALGLSVAVGFSYSIPAMAVRRWTHIDSPPDAASLVAMVTAGGIAAALHAVTVPALLHLTSAFEQAFDVVLPLFVGDLIGIAVFAPLTFRLIQYRLTPPPLPDARSLVEPAAYLVLIILALVVALYPAEGWPRDMFYLLFLPVGVASIRFGVDGACASLAVAQLVLVGILHLYRFDLDQFTDYQVTMLVLTLTGLIVGALASARQAAEEATRRAARRIAELQAQATRAARFNIVSSMSAALVHEINQPFTAARALARAIEELLRKPEVDAERARTNAASLVRQIDTAGAIINRMRAFLRRGEPHVSTVELERLVDDSLALVRPLAASRRIELDVEVPARRQTLRGDPVQLQQVIMNLVLNAIEAVTESSPADGRVSLRVAPLDDEVELSVRDNGAGISAERAGELFEPLYTTRREGMGLGLSICRSIVEAHGGRIWLHTGLPGSTEFRFTLPVDSRPVRP